MCRVVSVSGVGSGGRRLAHTVPGDVDATILSDGELSATNGAHGHGGMWLGVNRQGFGKFVLPGFMADVKNVPGFRVAFEINEVDRAFGIGRGLRLDAVVGSAKEFYVFGEPEAAGEQERNRDGTRAEQFHAFRRKPVRPCIQRQ